MDFDTFPFASFSQYLANGSFFLPVKNHVPMFGCNICSSITLLAGGAKSTVSDEKHLRNKQERFFEVNIAKKEPMQRIGSFQIHTIGTAFSVGIPNDAIPFLCFLSSESILSAFWHLSVLYQNELISSATLIVFVITFLDAQVLMQTFLYHRVVT